MTANACCVCIQEVSPSAQAIADRLGCSLRQAYRLRRSGYHFTDPANPMDRIGAVRHVGRDGKLYHHFRRRQPTRCEYSPLRRPIVQVLSDLRRVNRLADADGYYPRDKELMEQIGVLVNTMLARWREGVAT